MYKMHWNGVRPIATMFGILILMIPVLVIGVYFVQNHIFTSISSTTTASTARAMLYSLILKDQLDEETGIRGYVNTRDKIYLEPYLSGKLRMNNDFDEIKKLLHKLGSTSGLYVLADAYETNNSWQHIIADPMLATPKFDPLLLEKGKNFVDHFRQDINLLDGIISARVTTLDAKERSAIKHMSISIFFVLFFMSMLSIILGSIQFIIIYGRQRYIANAYQKASLPKKLPDVLGIVFQSFYRSGNNNDMVGGDWYDAVRLLDGRIIISVGDVAETGLEASVIMANMRQVIRGSGFVNPDPVLMLNAADKMLRTEYPNTTVTAFVGVIDAIERTFTYASAGHPPPFLRLPDGALKMLITEGLMLGLRSRDEPLSERLVIQDGSYLILYTNGLINRTKDYKKGEIYLRSALECNELYTSSNICKALHDVVLFNDVKNDVAILAIKWEVFPIEAKWPLSRWEFDVNDADAARRTQKEFTKLLQMDNISSDDIAMAELVFMELIGNVVRYAPGHVEIVVDWSGVCPVLHAIDRGSGFSYNPKLPDIFAESGRGIYMISMLTETFEILKASGGGSHACAVLLLGNSNVKERKLRLQHIDSETPSVYSYQST